ncbi:3'-5' exonuclease family protein [Burkholderia seminalis]|uniref:3'-5' exoribonuclease n=1 Tax=Burkholderia seminalis TaxID=488731 RepID=UPI001CF318ED|nr:3'-5' exoribonuclease [Burkholderia seminalis]MCA8041793.1 3'-5' exoribonuclease [Burkholderia seminalis]
MTKPIHFRGEALLTSDNDYCWNNRYFIDTEFTDFEYRQLISLAIVGENGHEFYGERTDFDDKICTEFARATVLPQLGQLDGRSMQLVQLRAALQDWFAGIPIAGGPVLCYDLEIDISLLRELLGGQLPDGWRLENIRSRIDVQRRATYYARHGGEHHALYDARANAWASTR